jgi:hypothetical protein
MGNGLVNYIVHGGSFREKIGDNKILIGGVAVMPLAMGRKN